MSEEHSLTPWHLGGISNPTKNPTYSIWGVTPFGKQSGDWIATSVNRANADHIILCVNSHDALVEACKRAYAQLHVYPEGTLSRAISEQIGAALQLAKGEK